MSYSAKVPRRAFITNYPYCGEGNSYVNSFKVGVCTDNLNAGVAVMKSAQDGA
jgi:hypothetical protein